jgi:U3 small nucleolar RNA-associated protein 3
LSGAGQIISGDADLPVKEDLGDRRRKHEIQKTNKELANMGDSDENSEEAVVNEPEEDDFYKQAVLLKEAKQAAKQAKYSRYVNHVILTSCHTLETEY